MTRRDFSTIAMLYQQYGDDLISLGRDLRAYGRLVSVFDGADIFVKGRPKDTLVAKLHHDGQTLYVHVSTQFLTESEDYRVWLVEEDEPLSDSTIRQMWDSYSDELIAETIEERATDDGGSA